METPTTQDQWLAAYGATPERDAEFMTLSGQEIEPQDDIAPLKELGVTAVFTPGAATPDIIEFMRETAGARR